MKLSQLSLALFGVNAQEKAVPPRHPLERLDRTGCSNVNRIHLVWSLVIFLSSTNQFWYRSSTTTDWSSFPLNWSTTGTASCPLRMHGEASLKSMRQEWRPISSEVTSGADFSIPVSSTADRHRPKDGDEKLMKSDTIEPIQSKVGASLWSPFLIICSGTREITTGFRKWAERYLSLCSGQRKYQYQITRMNKWNSVLQAHLARNAAKNQWSQCDWHNKQLLYLNF